MKKLLVSILLVIGMAPLYAQETAVDTSYNHWYYVSREKLYQKLKETAYDVVFFGNSITEQGPWQELIGRGYKVGNRGIGGDHSYGMKARVADVVRSKPKKIFLMMGINDIARGFSVAEILKNYDAIISTVKKQSPGTKIYVQSTLPFNEELYRADNLRGKKGVIADLNKGIKALAKKHRIPYVDVKKVLADGHVLKKKYTTDGLHLTTEGYIRWVDYLKDKKYL